MQTLSPVCKSGSLLCGTIPVPQLIPCALQAVTLAQRFAECLAAPGDQGFNGKAVRFMLEQDGIPVDILFQHHSNRQPVNQLSIVKPIQINAWMLGKKCKKSMFQRTVLLAHVGSVHHASHIRARVKSCWLFKRTWQSEAIIAEKRAALVDFCDSDSKKGDVQKWVVPQIIPNQTTWLLKPVVSYGLGDPQFSDALIPTCSDLQMFQQLILCFLAARCGQGFKNLHCPKGMVKTRIYIQYNNI